MSSQDQSASPGRFSTYRMIAIDLDGTLLSPTSAVTPRTRDAVLASAAAGWIVCFATGRTWSESESALSEIGHNDVAVFVGGAIVVDTAQRTVLHRTVMRPNLAEDVCAFFEARGHVALALQDRAASDVDYLISGNLPQSEATQLWMRVSGCAVREVPHLGRHPHHDTMRVSIAGPPAEMTALLGELNAAFGPRVQSHTVGYHHHAIDVLEAFDPSVDKWQGVVRAAQARAVDPMQVIAVGDSMNDLSMIRGAGLGVAMGNAKEAVKAAAARVIGANGADGLAIFLETLGEPSAGA